MASAEGKGPIPTSDEPASKEIGWGSDAIVEQLSRLGLRYIALVPGSSYRGVQDSLVNYNGNKNPEILMCLHEEHCVAIAHGYAKVKEHPMAAAVHANVGLMHATMAVYNAFCDRVPLLLLGATGPLDAEKRRAWIDWIHTATDQAALVRPFIKFDDQPMSVNAAIASLTRASAIASQIPRAPVYVCLDVSLQEDPLTDTGALRFANVERHLHSTSAPGAVAEDVVQVASLLQTLDCPLFLFGRLDRTKKGWDERIELAERFGARVLTDLKQAAPFPNHHPLHASRASVMISSSAGEVIRRAGVIVSFDWVDLAGTLQAAYAREEPSAKVVHLSLDSTLHNGWSKDHFGHPPADLNIVVDANKFVAALLATASQKHPDRGGKSWDLPPQVRDMQNQPGRRDDDSVTMTDIARALYANVDEDECCLVRLPLGWDGDDIRATHPLAFLGQDGGAGIGSGPGQAIGAALALKDSLLLPVAILGDGDFMMSSSAVWTAARYKIPLLIIVANNFSFYNDEVHQERVAERRGRPVENKSVGIKIDNPAPNIGQNAASVGARVLGEQVKKRGELNDMLRAAVLHVKEQKSVVVVDVWVPPKGYSASLGEKK